MSDTAATAPTAGDVFKFYHYDPTVVGGAIFAILFLGTTGLHFWQLIRRRCWLVIPLAIGGIFELVGYAARCKSGNETPNWTLGPYIMQSLLLLMAPALFAATIYMQLSRIVIMVEGERFALLPKKWMTKVFVTGDILSFLFQGGGGGYQASGTLEALNLGAKIIIVGLFVQLAFFGVFIIIAVRFDRGIRSSPTSRSTALPWKRHMLALYAGSLLIMVRSVFRAVEYLQGFDGYLLSHEIYLYIFDALLMFFVMIIFNWIHPGEVASLIERHDAGDAWKMSHFGDSRQRLGTDV